MTLEQEGNPHCEHHWVYDCLIVATNPPISHKICVICGRVEHEQGSIISLDLPFDDIYRKFHREKVTP